MQEYLCVCVAVVVAIPLVKRYDLKNMEGTQKLLTLMNCFRGDLPQVHGIVGKSRPVS